jgi:hypothetical protein
MPSGTRTVDDGTVPARPGRLDGSGWYALIALVIAALAILLIAGGALSDASRWLGERYFWETNVVVGVIAVIVIAALVVTTDAANVHRTLAVAAVAAACLVIPFYIPFFDGHSVSGPDLESRYCAYGASAAEEYDACLGQVSIRADIDGQETSAARFARGEGGCLADAGSLCASADELVGGDAVQGQ